jgi:hypothetical protein
MITSAGDVWQLGFAFRLMEIRLAKPVSPLVQRMMDDSMENRPTSKGVLLALNQCSEPLTIKHPVWQHPFANLFDDKTELIHDDSYGIQRIVTLLQHGNQCDDIECAFWMLFEAADKEVEDYESGGEYVTSVLSCLHFFHARMNFGALNKLFYCKALCRLSVLPYFQLSDDMKLHLNHASSYSPCERLVLCILSRRLSPALLEWCVNLRGCGWGKRQQPFLDFVARFEDSDDAAAVIANTVRAMGDV